MKFQLYTGLFSVCLKCFILFWSDKRESLYKKDRYWTSILSVSNTAKLSNIMQLYTSTFKSKTWPFTVDVALCLMSYPVVEATQRLRSRWRSIAHLYRVLFASVPMCGWPHVHYHSLSTYILYVSIVSICLYTCVGFHRIIHKNRACVTSFSINM